MPSGGKLTIETANCFLDEAYVAAVAEPVQSGQYVLIAVTDCGAGMDNATLERAFDPFFTTKEVGKGTGLGLSICYGIVKEHGGEILCHNNTDGPGATFVVRFPAAPHSASLSVAAGVIQQ
jgi:signal transduction histidine kinase